MGLKEYFKIVVGTVIVLLVAISLFTLIFMKGFNLGIAAGELICKEERQNEND